MLQYLVDSRCSETPRGAAKFIDARVGIEGLCEPDGLKWLHMSACSVAAPLLSHTPMPNKREFLNRRLCLKSTSLHPSVAQSRNMLCVGFRSGLRPHPNEAGHLSLFIPPKLAPAMTAGNRNGWRLLHLPARRVTRYINGSHRQPLPSTCRFVTFSVLASSEFLSVSSVTHARSPSSAADQYVAVAFFAREPTPTTHLLLNSLAEFAVKIRESSNVN